MPAVSLCCRVCATEHPLEATGTCTRCFGPLDPIYDWDALRATRQPCLDRGRAASIWRYADLLPVDGTGGGAARSGDDAARPGAPPRRGARDRRALAQARHGQPDALVQGSRRRRRGPQGAGARPRHALVLVDRATSPERSPRVPPPRASRRPSSCRATSSPRSSPLPPSTALASTPSPAPTTTARASRSSCRSSCRGGSSTSTCARTTPRARRRSPTRSPSSSAGRRRTRSRSRSPRARSSTRSGRASRELRALGLVDGDDAGALRRPGGRLRAGRDGVPRGRPRRARATRQHRPLARDREPGRRRLRGRDGTRDGRSDPHGRRGRDRLEHGATSPRRPASSARRRPASRSAR